MRRIAAAFFVLALAPVTAFADDEPPYPPASDAHRPGRWSMQVQLGPHFDVSNFQGAGLALTRNSSEHSAWRLGATLAFDHRDSAYDAAFSDSSGGSSSGIDGPDGTFYSINVGLLRLKRYQPARRIGFELGFGPQVSYWHNTVETKGGSSSLVFTSTETTVSSFFGIAARLGTEVMLARSLSIHAHYGFHGGYSHESQKFVSEVGDVSPYALAEEKRNGWLLEQEGVVFGASVYL